MFALYDLHSGVNDRQSGRAAILPWTACASPLLPARADILQRHAVIRPDPSRLPWQCWQAGSVLSAYGIVGAGRLQFLPNKAESRDAPT